MRIPHYCVLCQAEEVRVHGKVLHSGDERHERACFDAGCPHPAFDYDKDLSPERYKQIDEWLKEQLGDG